MAKLIWKAPAEVYDVARNLIEHDHPHLADSRIAIGFVDSKVFSKGRFNWGKVSKFSKLMKLWQPKDLKYDFYIILCADAWQQFLSLNQKVAWLDLCLCRCQVEHEPLSVEKNGKKTIVKDEFGRVEYTDNVKVDDDGEPVWKVAPLGIDVFAKNIKRYGLWCEDMLNLKHAIDKKETSDENSESEMIASA